MPKLDATKTYEDNKSPVQTDLDNFIDDIEIIVNVTKLDDDNLVAASITASSKFVAGSVTAGVLQNNSVTTAKILDGAVSTEKILDDAVTSAKILDGNITEAKANIVSGYLPVGSTTYFHTYNGTVAIPRGWMLCNGDVIDETNYESNHSVGNYATDSVSGSAIDGKNLPNMADKYAIGVEDTTQSGASAITSVGNSGNIVDITHNHSYTHDHSQGRASFAGALTGTAGSDLAATANNDIGSKETFIRTDFDVSVSTTSGSATQSIQPESIEMQYIMKVV